jgi:hypothetical protein
MTIRLIDNGRFMVYQGSTGFQGDPLIYLNS